MTTTKNKNGIYVLRSHKQEDPIVVYRLDELESNTESHLLLLKICQNKHFNEAQLCLQGDRYGFIRGDVLRKTYNPKKSPLTENQYKLLQAAYHHKLIGLENTVQ
ncbi:MAG: hypothetical protein AABX16_01670 [Nanoarchaeota archaeon]